MMHWAEMSHEQKVGYAATFPTEARRCIRLLNDLLLSDALDPDTAQSLEDAKAQLLDRMQEAERYMAYELS